MTAYRLRAARADELEALRTLERAAAGRFVELGLEALAELPPSAIEDLEAARRAGTLIVAADEAGEVVGFALALEGPEVLHLAEMDVHPEHGRRGIGARLLEGIRALARARGVTRITLTTFRDIPFNGPFYEKRGFVPLPEEALDPFLSAVRAAEIEAGLDLAPRVAMSLRV